MIFGHINSPSTYQPLLHQPVWIQAFNVLHALGEETDLGISPIKENKMFINVHQYNTKKISECRFEGHREMIDLQYVISGSEIIEWADKTMLLPDSVYDHEKDIQFYKESEALMLTKIHLKAGHFAIFFPDDAHRPQITDGYSFGVYKAVIKIHRELLNIK